MATSDKDEFDRIKKAAKKIQEIQKFLLLLYWCSLGVTAIDFLRQYFLQQCIKGKLERQRNLLRRKQY